jgi:hypothetical protein
VHKSIYLPRSNDTAVADAIALMEQPPICTFIGILTGAGVVPTQSQLRKQFSELLGAFQDGHLEQAIKAVCGQQDPIANEGDVDGSDVETRFRRQEYNMLVGAAEFEELILRPAELKNYAESFTQFFDHVTLVHKLRETRALSGFTRVFADVGRSLADLQSMLWRRPPEEKWLPAYVVYGEGIFFSLNELRLREWEKSTEVQARVQSLVARYASTRQFRQLRPRPQIGARFVLAHTLAHLLINRLTFECGYSSASLRERLYVSTHPTASMAGILIYTAAGDADGTLGGLVRMGKSGRIEALLERALANAEWCSADPVCMEMGQSGGQGPDSLNLAACHGCSLVPETACEEFNRLLDRGLLIGTADCPSIGYFKRGMEK